MSSDDVLTAKPANKSEPFGIALAGLGVIFGSTNLNGVALNGAWYPIVSASSGTEIGPN